MCEWYICPECENEEDITTIADTLYICDVCDHQYNPRLIYG